MKFGDDAEVAKALKGASQLQIEKKEILQVVWILQLHKEKRWSTLKIDIKEHAQ
jgi:hypothetical protein